MDIKREIRLNKNTNIPYYEQIYQRLKSAIVTGSLAVGDKIPTEEEICSELNVSRPVVRQAYYELVNNGYVVRVRGKGTYVCERENRGLYLTALTDFSSEAEEMNAEPTTVLVSAEVIEPTDKMINKMNLENGEKVFRIIRTRFLNGKPYSYIENHISYNRFPKIAKLDFSVASLYKSLSKMYGVMPHKASRTLMADIISHDVAQLLSMDDNIAACIMESVVYDQFEEVMEYSYEVFPNKSSHFNIVVYAK